MKPFINPYKMGLLGGLANWANSMEKYNLINAQNEGRVRAYHEKYAQMGAVQQMREQNNMLLKKLQLESNQRTYQAPRNNPDGSTDMVTYRNVAKSDGSGFEPVELGHVPYQAKTQAGNQKVIGNTLYEKNAQTGEWEPKVTDNSKEAATSAREDARDNRLSRRLDQQQSIADQRESAKQKSDAARLTRDDLKEYDKADPDTRKALLKSAGIDADFPDPNAKTWYGSPDSAAKKPNEKAREQYRQAMLKAHQQDLGLAPESKADPAAGPHAQFTPDGRQIKYDAQGRAFIKGKDGKSEAYQPDASGNHTGSPLAMDEAPDEQQAVAQDEPAQDQDDESSPGQGLLADEEAPAAEAEDTRDDNEQDQQTQGLLSGQYA